MRLEMGRLLRLVQLLRPVLLLIITLSTCVRVSGAAGAQGRPTIYAHDAVSLSRSKLYRWKQRWCHKRLNRRIPQHIQKAHHHRGTSLGLGLFEKQRQGPSEDLVSKLFWSSSHVPFNHNMVGMTNPCLHIGGVVSRGGSDGNDNHNNNVHMITVPASVTSSKEPTAQPPSSNKHWWPGTACCPDPDDTAISGDSNSRCDSNDDGGDDDDCYQYSNHWMVLRFRRRVGHDSDCYQRVRDAALRWEFDSDSGDQGMVQVTASSSSQSPSSSSDYYSHSNNAPGYTTTSTMEKLDYDDLFRPTRSDQVMQIWSGPGRRLVTYAKWRLLPKPIKVYAMSPVSVVYDLVDQRGPGTTYTSTAYATLQGHWLRGEERVTVALRDNGFVDVEILSFSRPAKSWQGRLAWRFIGGMQRSFFEQQMKAFERVAAKP